MGSSLKFSRDLLERIRRRANDPERRTHLAGGLVPHPPNDDDWTKAEKRIGRRIPSTLKQLYSIGNGGFGPCGGLLAISEVTEDHSIRTSGMFGPGGQAWPEELIVLSDPKNTPMCLDLKTGKVIAWEADRIENDESESDWRASFVEESTNLVHWFEDWLHSETHEEMRARLDRELAAKVEARGNSPVTGFPIQFDDLAEHIEAEIQFLEQAPLLRAQCGLPEVDWQSDVRRRYKFEDRD